VNSNNLGLRRIIPQLLNFRTYAFSNYCLLGHAVTFSWDGNNKQVWKGMGGGEGKNLSLKGFPSPHQWL
jgi:hypothetical protein